ncbi:hypothetical protein GCM10020000_18770 [Streptomyces olivoverticillatus]
MGFHVDSEAGRLRRVILHRPDLELKRLTPSNKDALLFDDVLWVRRARAEHDGFADVLRERGVEVHFFQDLLAESMSVPEARALVLDRVFDEKEYGPLATDHLRAAFDAMPAAELTSWLVGGMTKREFLARHAEPVSVRFHVMERDDFLINPLPNHLFTRDTSAWIYDGVCINAMRWPARWHETVHYEAVYRHHPLFAPGGFHVWSEGQAAYPSTIEGGDVLVIGEGAVLIGMSERTTPQAVEMLARGLFAAGSARTIVALDMPKRRAFMHLDTVMTMVDGDTFTQYAGLGMLRSYTIEPGGRGAGAQGHRPSAGAHAPRHRRRAGPRLPAGAHRTPGRARGRARAVGRRLQRPGDRTGRGRRLRAQRHDQHVPAQARHRGHHHPGQRTGPGPGRPALYELPGGAGGRAVTDPDPTAY